MNPETDVILCGLIRCWGAKQSYKKVEKPFLWQTYHVSILHKSDKTITLLLWLERQFTEDQKVAGSIPVCGDSETFFWVCDKAWAAKSFL